MKVGESPESIPTFEAEGPMTISGSLATPFPPLERMVVLRLIESFRKFVDIRFAHSRSRKIESPWLVISIGVKLGNITVANHQNRYFA